LSGSHRRRLRPTPRTAWQTSPIKT
jgi:hypothetical protein